MANNLFNKSMVPNQRGSSACLGLLTTTFALTAFCLMFFGSLGCNFLKFTNLAGASQSVTRTFGLWYYQFWAQVITTDGIYIVKTCQSYPDAIVFDASWKSAIAFSIIAWVTILCVAVGKCIMLCNNNPETTSTKLDAPCYILLALSQGLVLLLLNSELCKNNPIVAFGEIEWQETCSMSTGAKCTISSMVFWLAAALSSFQELKSLEIERRTVEPEASLTEPLTQEA